MSDERLYSDEEFAVILRKAAELASQAELPARSSAGLTLTEMKTAAAEAGLDPTLVERAARLLTVSDTASPFERLIGGPLRHDHRIHVPTRLDEHTAARLLSAVRIIAGQTGRENAGHSSALGMTWHDGGEVETLSVSARAEENGTSAFVSLDRRGTLGLVATFSGVAIFLALLFAGSALYPEDPTLGFGGAIVGVGGVLAIARGYWASTTRAARERISAIMDAVGRTLAEPDSAEDVPKIQSTV